MDCASQNNSVIKRLLIIGLLCLPWVKTLAQIPLLIDNHTYTNSDGAWGGVNIPRSTSTLLTFRNNSITSVNTYGFMLQCGDDDVQPTANNLDNAIITGNKFDWNGTPFATACHGMMAGYNSNYEIKYNYVDGPYYGIVHEGGHDDGTPTVNTGKGISYNIFKNCVFGVLTMGYENVYIYNNTFYIDSDATDGLITIASSNGTDIPAPSKNVKIKNNIFYATANARAINLTTTSGVGFECDYNIYYWESTSGNKPRFTVDGVIKSWEEWRALGYDTHSQIINPNFITTNSFVPTLRLDYGTDLGEAYNYGLATTEEWIIGQNPDTVKQNGVWQAGAIIYNNASDNFIPAYLNSVIENATPARLEMTYNLSLANIIPAASTFTVRVNSTARTVSSVAISGTKVLLTLATPVVYGDVVTVAYTKPTANPMQTTSGGQAATLTAQSVTNNCSPATNLPPVVNLSSPTKNTSYISPATITIDATASDPDGTISKVEFYQGTVKLGEKTSAPYSYEWKEVPEGTYTITAAATDNQNLRSVSTAVSVVVEKYATAINQIPVVNITTPGNSKKYKKNDKILFEAVASDPDGTVTKVEFKNGNTTLSEMTTAPYTYTWEAVDTGTFVITVIATDNLGATSASLNMEFIVDLVYDANSEIINLYPNPNDGHFTIDLYSPIPNQNSKLTIINTTGKIIVNDMIRGDEGPRQFDISNSSAGTYILCITAENKIVITQNFIKN